MRYAAVTFAALLTLTLELRIGVPSEASRAPRLGSPAPPDRDGSRPGVLGSVRVVT